MASSIASSMYAMQQEIEWQLEQLRCALPPADGALSLRVRKVVHYIHANLFDPDLSAAIVRIRCGLRDHNVSSQFRRELGCAIKEYIDARRLEVALPLLQDARFSIFEIGQSLGYRYPQTFYRVYKRAFGAAPASERRASPNAGAPALISAPADNT
jgi:AraC-like DNA-binding protein